MTMAQPPLYDPTVSFQQEETNNVAGRSTVRTAALDTELANIATSIDALVNNIGLIQRDDGEIRDGMVKLHTLDTAVLALLTGSNRWNVRGEWVTATAYAYLDFVEEAGASYLCLVAHTSGTFATDYAAGKWMIVSATNAGSLSSGEIPVSDGLGGFTGASSLTKSGNTTTAHTLTVSTGSLTVTGGQITTAAATPISLLTSQGEQVRILNVTSASRYITLGGTDSITALCTIGIGGGGNMSLAISSTGTGVINLRTNDTVEQVRINHVASADRYLILQGGASGASTVPTITTSGGNISLGRSLVTTLTTFSLINDTATTVNFAGAATTLNVGASNCVTNLGSTVRIGTTTAGSGNLRIVGTGAQLELSSVETDATNKVAIFVTSRYTNSETPFVSIRSVSTSTANSVTIGGSAASFACATSVAIHTGALSGSGGTGTARITVDSTGNTTVSGEILNTGHPTTGSAANAFLNSGTGQLARSTSSVRFKKAFEIVQLERARSIMMGAEPVTYASNTEVCKSDNPAARWYGFKAEQIAELEPLLVDLDGKGRPERVQYERFVIVHNVVLKDHEERIRALEQSK